MATKTKHKERSKRSSKNINLSRESFFGHCMQFQAGVKKEKEAWKKV